MRTNGTEIMIISIILIIKKTVAVEENLSADLSTLNEKKINPCLGL